MADVTIKVLRVRLENTLVAGPDWTLASPNLDGDEVLRVGGEYYEPIIKWLRLTKVISPSETEWEEIDEEDLPGEGMHVHDGSGLHLRLDEVEEEEEDE